MAALAALLNLAPPYLGAVVLVFLRIGASMALLPAFGELMIPGRVRLALTLAFTAIVVPAVAPALAAAEAGRPLLALAGGEVLAGLMLGVSLRFVVIGLQLAGTMAAQATSLAQLLGGASVEPQPALGLVLLLGALALVTSLGLHVQMAAMFIGSYDILGPGAAPVPGDVARWGTALAGGAFRMGFLFAMPFVAASLVYNLALGVINRAMPQLMVALVGAPAITFGALLLLALAAPEILALWQVALEERLADPFGPP